MSYDIYEVPMYHNGTFNRGGQFNKVISFTSEQTGRTYPIRRLEPESLMFAMELYENDSDFRDHLYVEDMTITHEISGDVDSEGFAKACWLDGKPLSTYQQLSADFKLAIEDTVEQEHMYAYE